LVSAPGASPDLRLELLVAAGNPFNARFQPQPLTPRQGYEWEGSADQLLIEHTAGQKRPKGHTLRA